VDVILFYLDLCSFSLANSDGEMGGVASKVETATLFVFLFLSSHLSGLYVYHFVDVGEATLLRRNLLSVLTTMKEKREWTHLLCIYINMNLF
jgi:hypothetical protein